MKTSTLTAVSRPPFATVAKEDGLKWSTKPGWIFEEKYDGVWSQRCFITGASSAVLVGEQMRGGDFYAFDLISIHGTDVRDSMLSFRLMELDFLALGELRGQILRPLQSEDGGALLRQVLERGGEGIVAKELEAPFGATWHKCKRSETHDLIVAEKDTTGKPTIRVTNALGEDFGWVPCRAQFDHIRVGDIVEIFATGRHPKSGLLREARFVRVRKDKMGIVNHG